MAVNDKGSKVFFGHVRRMWFNPEANPNWTSFRRIQTKENSSHLCPETKSPIINFYGEVEPVERLKANQNYLNCGHVTFFQVVNGWEGMFDFRYNKGRATELFERA